MLYYQVSGVCFETSIDLINNLETTKYSLTCTDVGTDIINYTSECGQEISLSLISVLAAVI